ncbi:MAG: shikimate dehydrogenase [Methanoculleus sp.]
MKVVLVGFRGTGKTAVGRILADRLKVPFYDTDALIERRTGMSIPEIFRRYGEVEFRILEREVIASLRDAKGVISTGGGAVSDPANVADLRWHGMVVLLTAAPAVILDRIAGSDRPGLTDLSPAEEVQALLAARQEAYIGAADVCIDTGRYTPEEVADLVLQGAGISGEERVERNTLLERFGLADLRGMIDRDPDLRVCAIAGNPCAHSKSPLLYNRLFAHFGMNYHYTRFEWPDAETIVRLASLLPTKGFAVTIPFKADVMRSIDEIDDHAAAIGAVNTVVRCGDRMYGYNTDWLGVRTPLLHRQGARAVVLGAGGAAAAAAYGLLSLDMDVRVLARRPDAARGLGERFGCRWGGLETFRGADTDVVVDATPVGMEPDTRSLLEPGDLEPGTTVFDLVYTPPETPLIRAAKEAGCETIPGTEMFVHQAVAQFRFLTGIAVTPALVREMLV